MGKRGPLKKSASATKLAGNPGKRKKAPAAAAAAPIGGTDACPDWLSEAAKKEWRRALPLLKEPLEARDAAAFACYCQSLADVERATAEIDKHGLTYKHPNGTTVPHPAVKMQAAAMARVKQFGSEFGLTPASRSRVPDPQQEPEKDRLGEFLADGPTHQ